MKTIVSDLSRVLLFNKDPNYKGSLNDLNRKLLSQDKEYNFWDYFQIDNELLNFYKKMKPNTMLAILTSDQIQNHPALRPILEDVFDHIFSAKEIGIEKTNPLVYETVSSSLEVDAGSIIYIDDSAINIEAASVAGLNAWRHISNEKTFEYLKKIKF